MQCIAKRSILCCNFNIPLNPQSHIDIFSLATMNVATSMMRMNLITTMRAITSHETKTARHIFGNIIYSDRKVFQELQTLAHEHTE